MHGIGVDTVVITRIRPWIEDEILLKYVFTCKEISYAFKGVFPHRILSGLFAAKEAFMKALGTGWNRGIHWRDIEVIEQDCGLSIRLYNKARERCSGKRVLVSIGLTDTLASALVVIEDHDIREL